MRVIKFRGKCVDSGEWRYGLLIQAGSLPIIRWQKMGAVGVMVHSSVSPETVGQYTGIKDKNGVEIYEGDLLSLGHDAFCKIPYRVVWNQHLACFSKRRGIAFTDLHKPESEESYEVIGNVVDNPELLEEDQ